jgi:hypothetical protein
LNTFFDGFLDKLGVPIIGERRLGSDCGFNQKFEFVMAGFAKIPVGQVKVVAVRNRRLDDIPAHIASKGLHIKLL